MIARKSSVLGGSFWLYLLLIVPFIELPILTQNQTVGHIYSLVQMGILVSLVIANLRRKKIGQYWIVMGLFFAVLCLASLGSEKMLIHALSESVRVIGFCSLLAHAAKRGRAQAFFKALWVVMAVLVVVNTFTMIVYPTGLYRDEQDYWQNWILGYKNSYIYYYLLWIMADLYLAYTNRGKFLLRNYLLIIILLAIAIMSESMTSAAGLAVILVLLPCYHFFQKHPRILQPAKIFVAYVAAFLAVIVFYIQDHFANLIEQIFSRNATFTGRTYLWQKAFEDIGERPLLGHGYRSPVYDLESGREAVTTHNFILDVMYKGGIVALALLAYLAILAMRPLKRTSNRMTYAWVIILIAFLIMSIVETYGFMLPMFILTLFYYVPQLVKEGRHEN